MFAPVLRRARSMPPGAALLAAVGLLAMLVVALAAADPKLPGPSVRGWLGIDQTPEYPPCRPGPDTVRAPSAPAPAKGRWRREPDLASARDELAGVALDGRLLAIGGTAPGPEPGSVVGLRDVEAYDPSDGGARRLPDVPAELDHSRAVMDRGEVVLLAGYEAARGTTGTYRYDAGRRRWTAEAPLNIARGGHGGAAADGQLYVVGGLEENLGERDTEPLASLEVYDSATGRWGEGPAMPSARHHVGLVAVDGRLYAAGGRRPGDFSMTAFERYDPATRRWERLAPLPQGVGGAAVVAAGRHVLVIGGGDDIEGWVTSATWAYDTVRGTWRRLPDLGTPRHGLVAAVLGDRVYAYGGAPCPGFGISPTVESLPLP